MKEEHIEYINFIVRTIDFFRSDCKLKLFFEDLLFLSCLSALETSYGKSLLVKTNNNFFGMKHPTIRSTMSLGCKNGHALYDNVWDSVVDLLMWLNYWHRYYPSLSVVELISKKYNPSKKYVSTIQSIVKSFKNSQLNA